ncbi:MAG: hypothetical protein A3H17_01810 [Candidatus Levybacteria bacterium RIFCSPLOWO2_12_FULL_37_14]|nr:MAG: hypothetical protein US43_C0001G0042 [Candidatus Levybacteria bacterium GW2011_GWA1_37_16]KKQ37965.1 MAG: hypothetical protein US55_C0018G0005 [Candidatus Levybacteria bacterium GW2011_GWC2_37_7]KKQ42149.1 MAG: hypothetical protein US59_C0014G0009 [Candidatus Levybacteria bacterium GW2011_GWB1_37_8]OGH51131.1 MAG: hypothetical protein A3H17_01810 [Candidatus Levybacteria bacterium RIFCSPLOWO2_12_FULL_37_14]
MSEDKLLLSSIAMDLKRVALGYYRKSDKMADRFLQEAIRRKNEINLEKVNISTKKLLQGLDKIVNENNDARAEDALMYSTLFQNAALK